MHGTTKMQLGDILTLAELAAPTWDSLLQLGGMSSITAVLLYTFLQDRNEHTKSLKAMSVTMVNFQQLLLVLTMSHEDQAPTTGEDFRKYSTTLEAVKRILEEQRRELEKVYVQK